MQLLTANCTWYIQLSLLAALQFVCKFKGPTAEAEVCGASAAWAREGWIVAAHDTGSRSYLTRSFKQQLLCSRAPAAAARAEAPVVSRSEQRWKSLHRCEQSDRPTRVRLPCRLVRYLLIVHSGHFRRCRAFPVSRSAQLQLRRDVRSACAQCEGAFPNCFCGCGSLELRHLVE